MFGYRTAKCAAELEAFSAEQERLHGQNFFMRPAYHDEWLAHITELRSRYGWSTLERAQGFLRREQEREFPL